MCHKILNGQSPQELACNAAITSQTSTFASNSYFFSFYSIYILQGIIAYSNSGKWVKARDLALQWRERASAPRDPPPLGGPAPSSSSSSPSLSNDQNGPGAAASAADDDDDDLLTRCFPPPPAVCNTALIKAMGKAGRTEEALAWLRDTAKLAAADASARTTATVSETTVTRSVPTLDYASFLAALSACSRAGEWESALQVLHEMDVAGVKPETSAYNTALAGVCYKFDVFFFCVLCGVLAKDLRICAVAFAA